MDKYREETLDWLDYYDCEWENIATLTFTSGFDFKKDTGVSIASRKFEKFAKKLKNKILGKKSNKIYEMLPIMELTKDERPHFHVLLSPQGRYTTEEFKLLILELWDEVMFTSIHHLRNGKNPEWFKSIRTGTQKNTIKYILKTLETSEYSKMSEIPAIHEIPESMKSEINIDFIILDYLYKKKFEGYSKPRESRCQKRVSGLLQQLRSRKNQH